MPRLKPELKQLVRYGIVGTVNTIGCYSLYLLLTYIGWGYVFTMTFLYVAGTSFSFFLNKSWTFDFQGNSLWAGVRFILVYVVGYLINLWMLRFFVDTLGYPHQLVQAAAIFVVAAFIFVSLKTAVFRSKKLPVQESK